MRGFLAGSLVLIAIYTLVQPGASSRVSASVPAIADVFERFVSAGTAGIPQRGAGSARAPRRAETPRPPR